MSPSHVATKGLYDCTVLKITNLVSDIYLMRMHCPPIAESVQPGQFVNINVSDEYIPLLRKPFSVCRRNAAEGWIELVWKTVGKGTRIMAEYSVGQTVNVLGPLGTGFHLPDKSDLALVVAGGLGVAPFPLLCEKLLESRIAVQVFLGARSQSDLSLVDAFEAMGLEVLLATEDGSLGRQGLVTELVVDRMHDRQVGLNYHFFSCGPTPFLNAMIDLSERFDTDGQVSLETMMGCGFGICVGCPVETRNPRPDENLYRLTCVDGPVFDARKVILHD